MTFTTRVSISMYFRVLTKTSPSWLQFQYQCISVPCWQWPSWLEFQYQLYNIPVDIYLHDSCFNINVLHFPVDNDLHDSSFNINVLHFPVDNDLHDSSFNINVLHFPVDNDLHDSSFNINVFQFPVDNDLHDSSFNINVIISLLTMTLITRVSISMYFRFPVGNDLHDSIFNISVFQFPVDNDLHDSSFNINVFQVSCWQWPSWLEFQYQCISVSCWQWPSWLEFQYQLYNIPVDNDLHDSSFNINVFQTIDKDLTFMTPVPISMYEGCSKRNVTWTGNENRSISIIIYLFHSFKIITIIRDTKFQSMNPTFKGIFIVLSWYTLHTLIHCRSHTLSRCISLSCQVFFNSWKKKKVTGSKVWWIRRMRQYSDSLRPQKFRHNFGLVSWRIVM